MVHVSSLSVVECRSLLPTVALVDSPLPVSFALRRGQIWSLGFLLFILGEGKGSEWAVGEDTRVKYSPACLGACMQDLLSWRTMGI